MFSQRLAMNLEANRLHRAREKKKSAGIAVLDLTESNPTRAGLLYNEPEVRRALADPKSMRYDPDAHGLLPARAAVAGYYAGRGETIDPAALFLTASTSEAYAFVFKLLADPGDEILAPLPCYPLLDFLTALEAVQLRHYPLRYAGSTGWEIDLNALAHVITTKTRAIVLVHPNNPTGSFVKPRELARLNELCMEHDLALICDEVFLDYSGVQGGPRRPSLVSNREALTFVLSGLSKICALPQMKLGWLYVNGPAVLRAEAIGRLEYIADAYLSAGTPVQHAAPGLLASRYEVQRQIHERVAANEAALQAACRALPECNVLPREGGWYAVIEIPPEIPEEEFAVTLLERENVFLHPGYFFDFPRRGFLVLSLLTPARFFEEGVHKMCGALSAGVAHLRKA